MKLQYMSLRSAALVLCALLVAQHGHADPPLLPFQGRLTGPSGTSIPDGDRVVQFKVYDSPVGGQAVWNGEVQKLTVNEGLVNTVLGTKADLSKVDFDQTLYLEITIDADGNDQITPADPPLLPRQAILPAVFAKESADSRKLAGYDWSSLFGINNPVEGTLMDSKLRDGSISAQKIQPGTVHAGLLMSNTITAGQIAHGTIGLANLVQQVAEALSPAGEITAFGGPNPPQGWLLCDGQAVSRTDYERLFATIGVGWGTGDGVTTFNVPDLRGYFLRGRDGNTARDPDRGNRSPTKGGNSGDSVGSYQQDLFAAHKHGIWLGHENGGSHDYAGYPQTDLTGPYAYHGPAEPNDIQYPDGRGNPIDLFGGAETRPKNAYVNYIIKY